MYNSNYGGFELRPNPIVISAVSTIFGKQRESTRVLSRYKIYTKRWA